MWQTFTGLSIFFKSTSTSLFTGGTFNQNLTNFHEYLIQHSLKSGGPKDHFRQVKVPGTLPLIERPAFTEKVSSLVSLTPCGTSPLISPSVMTLHKIARLLKVYQ
jgi:hypothetical protein